MPTDTIVTAFFSMVQQSLATFGAILTGSAVSSGFQSVVSTLNTLPGWAIMVLLYLFFRRR